MRTLRDLLASWENWSARDTLRRAIDTAATDQQVEQLDLMLVDTPTTAPLDALRDATELTTLLTGWRWQAVYAARVEQNASWEEIGQATAVTAEQARTDYLEAVERQEGYGFGDVTRYRAAV